ADVPDANQGRIGVSATTLNGWHSGRRRGRNDDVLPKIGAIAGCVNQTSSAESRIKTAGKKSRLYLYRVKPTNGLTAAHVELGCAGNVLAISKARSAAGRANRGRRCWQGGGNV